MVFGKAVQFMKHCDGRNHDLAVIYSHGNDIAQDVVRWCKNCGAVVIDVDYDGRTNAGQIMKMKFPKNAYEN